jgi:hypothetical protein
MEFWVEFREWKDMVLLSEGGKGLCARGDGEEDDAVGGARPLPLPRILPPPSFRPDMMAERSINLSDSLALSLSRFG